MVLSKLPTDVIPYISTHLTDSTILKESLRFRRSDTYLLYFFFHKNMPKDAIQYNKLLNDETKYYKHYDFTDHNKRDVSGILKTIKTKYKDLKLRIYDINFDKPNMIYIAVVVFGIFQYMIIIKILFCV